MTDTGTSSYVGMMIGRGTPGLVYTPVAAFLTDEAKPGGEKDALEVSPGERDDSRHAQEATTSECRSKATKSGAVHWSPWRMSPAFLEQGRERAHVPGGRQEQSYRFRDRPARFVRRATRTGHVERQGTSDKLVAFLPDVDGVVDAKAVFHGQGLPMRVTRNMIAPTPSPPCLHDAGRIRRTAEDSRRQAQERKWSGTHAVPRQRSHSTRVTVCARFLESLLMSFHPTKGCGALSRSLRRIRGRAGIESFTGCISL